jgi:hypothetical protein
MPAESLGKAVVILAIGSLDLGNGLPKFKVSKDYQSFQLQSGETLGALYHTPQIFEGSGGGLAHVSIWAKTATAPQQP